MRWALQAGPFAGGAIPAVNRVDAPCPAAPGGARDPAAIPVVRGDDISSASRGSRVAPQTGVGRVRARRSAPALIALLALLSVPRMAAPQALPSELTVFGINVLIGGTTSGLAALVTDRPVLPAVGKGLAGGSVVYLGKRLSNAGGFPMSGLVGRMVASTGTSFVRNGAAGRGLFDFMVFPFGPITIYKRPAGDRSHAPIKLHLARTAVLAALILRDDIRIDWESTLQSGAPVFDMTEGSFHGGHNWVAAGTTLCGSVVLSDLTMLPHVDPTRLLTHERIHVIQDDFADFAWTGPLEYRLLGHFPGGKWLRRYVDVGLLHVGVVGVAHIVIPYEQRPWEIEAEHFEHLAP